MVQLDRLAVADFGGRHHVVKVTFCSEGTQRDYDHDESQDSLAPDPEFFARQQVWQNSNQGDRDVDQT